MNFLRSNFFLASVLVICLSLPGGNVMAAQEAASLPGQFVYVENGSRLYLVRGNVEEPVLLVQTYPGAAVGNPRFSPDGRFLAYCIRDPETEELPSLWYLDTQTLEKFLVTEEGSCTYDWAPDGKVLVYSLPVEGGGIWSYSRETGELERLVETSTVAVDLRWSPDGKVLSYFDSCLDCVGQFHTYDLSTGQTKDWPQQGPDESIGPNIDWSPDGKSLAFDTEIPVHASAGETYGLYVVSNDGKTREEIHSLPGRGAFFPLWSPDGKQIAFSSYESFTIGNYLNRRADLMAVSPDGSDVRKLYTSIYEVLPQAWSPDGRYLLLVEPLSVAGEALPKYQLSLLDIQTGNLLWKIFSFGWTTADWAPLSSPDAETPAQSTGSMQMAGKAGILFVGSDYALSFYEPVTGQVQKLTAPFSGEEFSVSPDGRTILFGAQIVSIQAQAAGTVTASIIESSHPQFFYNLRWSPDSQKYGFVDENDSAWVVDLLGNREQLPDGESPPEWSYDGRWMAYCDKEGKLWIAESSKPADWIIQKQHCYVKWSPTQSILAYTTHPTSDLTYEANGTVFLYDPISGRTREIAQSVSSMDWSMDGELAGIRRTTFFGRNFYEYSFSVLNLETGQETLIGTFDTHKVGNGDWIEQADGYLVGNTRFQSDLQTLEPLADILFDATPDGKRLLVGKQVDNSIEIGCQDLASNSYQSLLQADLGDTLEVDAPGLYGQLSPDGNWALLGDFDGERIAHWLGPCGPDAPVRLAGNNLPYSHYFSPDSNWLIMEQTLSYEQPIPRILLYDLRNGSQKEVQAGINTVSAWYQMPVAPAVPSSEASEESLPLVSVTATGADGLINLQSDEPNLSGQSLLLPILLWGGLLIGFLVLAYLLWKRSVLAKVEGLSIAKTEVEKESFAQGTAIAEPVMVAAPEPTSPREQVESAFREGVELIRAGKGAEGIPQLRKVVAAAPDHEVAWFWLAIACVREKDHRAAERCFLQAKKHGHPEADKALAWLRGQMK